jgi:TPR repeat protein
LVIKTTKSGVHVVWNGEPKMQVLLEKLSQSWQFRYGVMCSLVVLIVYAVVMPVHSNEAVEASIATMASKMAGLSSSDDSTPGRALGNASGNVRGYWLGKNKAAAAQLDMAAEPYLEGGLPKDFSESIRKLRRAAEEGNPTAEFLLGHAYQRGWGVPKDMTEMARWYARGAKRRDSQPGDAVDQENPRDFAQAFDAIRRKAEEGDAGAELYIGLAYDVGEDLPRNAMEAARWYRRAAAQGSFAAASNLGVLYHDGDGMPKDNVAAVTWLGRAAAAGSPVAEYCLGRIYSRGEGVARDDARAVEWLEQSAAQGYAPAEVFLSAMYASGSGVEGITAKAYMWINLASASDEQARISRDEVERVIDPVEIAEGQKLTRDWLALHPRWLR